MSLRDKLPEELKNAYQLKLVRKIDGKVIFGLLSMYDDEAEMYFCDWLKEPVEGK